MTLSLRSDALEPTRPELASLSFGERVRRYLPVYGLPIIGLLLIILFSAIFPHTFPTLANVSAMIDNKAIIALLSLAVLAPMAAGKIDLTIGFGIVLWHILVISLQLNYNIPWEVAVVIVLVCGGALGTDQRAPRRVCADRCLRGPRSAPEPSPMQSRSGTRAGGRWSACFRMASMPSTEFTSWACRSARSTCSACPSVSGLVFEYLPLGRFIYAIGANPRAAALNGIPVRRYVTVSFIVSGVITAFAGVVLASQLQIGQASVGLDFLLPALVGVFLGSTTLKPGRVNVWGTLVGVAVLAIGISGIQQLGADFYVEPLFNGLTLIGVHRHRRLCPAQARGEHGPEGAEHGDAGCVSNTGR